VGDALDPSWDKVQRQASSNCEALRSLPVKQALIDGEAVALLPNWAAFSKPFVRRYAQRPPVTSPSIFSSSTAKTFGGN
jgi:hypothetical protein